MNCISGKCLCNYTQEWNGRTCGKQEEIIFIRLSLFNFFQPKVEITKRLYDNECEKDEECYTKYGLSCAEKKCKCSPDKYWSKFAGCCNSSFSAFF